MKILEYGKRGRELRDPARRKSMKRTRLAVAEIAAGAALLLALARKR